MIYPEAGQALIHTGADSASREVEFGVAITSDLGGKIVFVPGYISKRLAKHRLCPCQTVIWRDVYEVDAEIDCGVHGPHTLGGGDISESTTERRSTQTQG